MRKICWILVSAMLLSACKTENTNSEETEKNSVEKEGFEYIQELFDQTDFDNPVHLELLKEIKICTLDTMAAKKPGASLCSAENFKFFPLRKDLNEKNGFLLLVKATTGGFPLRRLLVFQRERGELVKANGFVANLIGRIPTESGYDDLLLRFNDKDGTEDMFYNCVFTWNGSQYQFKQVDVIEGSNWGGPVKAQFKDSISKEIYQNILNNQMVF